MAWKQDTIKNYQIFKKVILITTLHPLIKLIIEPTNRNKVMITILIIIILISTKIKIEKSPFRKHNRIIVYLQINSFLREKRRKSSSIYKICITIKV